MPVHVGSVTLSAAATATAASAALPPARRIWTPTAVAGRWLEATLAFIGPQPTSACACYERTCESIARTRAAAHRVPALREDRRRARGHRGRRRAGGPLPEPAVRCAVRVGPLVRAQGRQGRAAVGLAVDLSGPAQWPHSRPSTTAVTRPASAVTSRLKQSPRASAAK